MLFSRILPICCGLIAVVLTGCVSAPRFSDRPPAIDVPQSWFTASCFTSDPATSWDLAINDPQTRRLVDTTLRANLDLRLAMVRLNMARVSLETTSGARLPSVNLTLDASREQQVAHDDGQIRSRTNRFAQALGVRWEMDLWGRLADLAKASESDLAARGEDLEAARQSLAAQTIRLYYELIAARGQERLIRDHLHSLRVSERLVRARFTRGLSSLLDLRRMQAEVPAAEAEAERSGRTARAIARGLATLMGQAPDWRIHLDPATLPDNPPSTPTILPMRVLERRPDVRAATSRILAADLRTSASEKALLPDISLTAALGMTSEELHRLMHGSNSVWNIGAGLVQPLFQGGLLRAEIRRAGLEAEEAWLLFSQAVQGALKDVEDGLDAQTELAHRRCLVLKRLDLARSAETQAWKAYTAADADMLDVLEARRQVITASREELETRADALINRLNLALALGEQVAPPYAGPRHVPPTFNLNLTAQNRK